MEIICISGKARHGKDTTANFLKELLEKDGNKVLITHYGDILKYICTNYFNWDGEKDEHGRHMLQYVGTDLIRKKDPNFFTDFMVSMLSLCKDNWDYVIIPDCRFPNELSALRFLNSDRRTMSSIRRLTPVTHIRVVRDNYESVLNKRQQEHPSETALDDYVPDYYVRNDGTLEDLKKCILNLYENQYFRTRIDR